MAELARLNELLSPQSSFAKLREALRSGNPPSLPYVGCYLADLTFIEEGNPDMIGNLINFAKRRLVVDVVLKLESFASASYDIEPSLELDAFFQNLPQYNDKELYSRSLACEPRGADLKDIK